MSCASTSRVIQEPDAKEANTPPISLPRNLYLILRVRNPHNRLLLEPSTASIMHRDVQIEDTNGKKWRGESLFHTYNPNLPKN